MGEYATPLSMTKRAEFDVRILINVVFEDGARGALFADEIQLGDPLCKVDSSGPLERNQNAM